MPAPVMPVPPASAALPGGAEDEMEAAAQALDDLFSESADALVGLKSYRYATTFSYTGGEGGVPGAGSIEVRGTVASAERQSMTWKDFESGDEFSLVRVGSKAWLKEDAEWTEVPDMVADAMSQGILVFAPVTGWSGMVDELQSSSTLLGTETVNGVSARHYASTYREWTERWSSDVTEAKGDVWIAEAGYPVRFRLSATSTDEEGNRTTILWNMDLTEVNADLTVEAPQ